MKARKWQNWTHNTWGQRDLIPQQVSWFGDQGEPWEAGNMGCGLCSELGAGLQTKESLARFPVRARAWVAGLVPSRGRSRGNHTTMFLSLPSLLSIKINK